MQAKQNNSPLLKNLITFGFFVLCAAAFFGWKISQGYVLAPEDNFVQNYPAFASPGKLWTPLLLCGFPLVGDPQVQTFYPLAHLARLISPGPDLTTSFNLYIISAFVLAAFFTAMLARKLTGSFYAGLLAGLSYGFSGYLISELKHVQVLHTALWLPLALYLIERWKEKFAQSSEGDGLLPRVLVLFFFSLVVALTIFAGHPQTALYVLFTVLVYAILISSDCGGGKKSLIFLLSLLVAMGSGCAMAMIQILPSMELSALSDRVAFTFKDFVIGQVEPMQLLGFFIPYLMGGAYGTIGDLPFSEQGPPPGLLFFGFAPIILAIYGAKKNAADKKLILFFAVLAAFALVLSLGSLTPLSQIVYLLPFWGKFRGLYRVLILFSFAISMLGAIGMARLERDYSGEAPHKTPHDLVKMGNKKHFYILLYIVLSCFSYPFFLGSLPILLFMVRLDFLSFLSRPGSSLRQVFLILLALFVLGTYAFNAEWTKASPLASDLQAPSVASSYGAKTSTSRSRIFTVKGLAAERDQIPPNLSRLWGVASATGYEPLVYRRYSRLMGISEGGFMQPPWRIKGANRAFDITCVKYLFAPWDNFEMRGFDQSAKKIWKMCEGAQATLIYENRRVMPRFYVVPEARILSDEEIYQSIIAGKLPDGSPFEPDKTVLLETTENSRVTRLPPAKLPAGITAGTVAAGEVGDERISLSADLLQPAFLVLADSFYPGWQVSVNGARDTILQANYVQRAVLLPAGKSTVIFTYEPESLARGRNICAAVFALWLLVLVASACIKTGRK